MLGVRGKNGVDEQGEAPAARGQATVSALLASSRRLHAGVI